MFAILPMLLACPPAEEEPLECPAIDAGPVVAACFAGPGDGEEEGRTTRSGDWEGFVDGVGTDAWPADCTAAFGATPTAGWWATLSTTQGRVVFAIDAPGVAAPEVGARVGVRATYAPGDVDAGGLELTDSIGDLVAFAGQSTSPVAIVPPDGWGFSQGATECASADGCVEGFSIAVQTADSSTGDVDLGTTEPVGAWLFTNAQFTTPVESGECASEPAVARVSVTKG